MAKSEEAAFVDSLCRTLRIRNARQVEGNDALDVYHATRWARTTALEGKPAFLDCLTFRAGLYSSHFGEVRTGIEEEVAEWQTRDPLKRMGDRLVQRGLATFDALEQARRDEERRVEQIFREVCSESTE